MGLWRAIACACLVGCGAARPPVIDEPVPSTAHDPTTWTRATASESTTGEPVTLTITGGAEQARTLLTTLVLAIRDGNEAAIEAAFAERVVRAQPGITPASWTRAAIAGQILAGAAAAQIEADVPFALLIDPATIQVLDVAAHFQGQVPPGVAATDEVVLFSPSALGRRLLSGLGSSGVLVVRPGPTPVVIAR